MASSSALNTDHENGIDDPRTPLLKKATSTSHWLSDWASLSLQDWFGWEVLSAFVAMLSLVAIASLLAAYDSSSLPDWPSVITINTVVSFFSTIGKLAVMAVVGASISQSKWLWYKSKQRPLQDIQMFDTASRGPWGALALVLAVNIRSQATTGAIIIILMLLFDPFLQQVVVYPDRLVSADKPSTIARARSYDAHSYEGLSLPSVLDLSMKAAIYSGIFDVSEQADAGTQHLCSTVAPGTIFHLWPSVVNAFSLPGGPSISGLGGQINTSVTRISSELEHLNPSVLQFSALVSQPLNSSDGAIAWECALSYCVNVYSAAVHDGTFKQDVKASWLNNSASYSQGSDLIYRPPASIINMTDGDPDFRISNLVARAMNAFMSRTFTGSGSIDPSASGSAFSSDVIQALYGTKNYSTRVAALATSMTNNIRQQNGSNFGPLTGQALKSETYVHVRWAWFCYPALVVLLTVILLVGIIIENAHDEVRVWGASNVALLFHGQGLPLDDMGHHPTNKISQMTKKAKAVNVRLIKANDKEWKLVEAG